MVTVPSYNFPTAFDAAQKERASDLLRWGARENWSTTELQTRLQREGLGYRRANLIRDYEHARVVSLAKTADAEGRAESFYQRVYKPFKSEMGLNTAQMGKILSAYHGQAEIPEELEEAFEEYEAWVETEGS